VFGVLPLHAPTLSTLKPGFVDVYKGGIVVEQYFVTGGFAEVTPTSCTVLVDEALPKETLTQAMAAERQTVAKALFDAAATDEDRHAALTALATADAMLQAANGTLH
jgi:F-type H+-transporting ATPase subunit epsilon